MAADQANMDVAGEFLKDGLRFKDPTQLSRTSND
jgi:hypothetical protein